jgi:RNA polymerase sigma-70 factor (ECF subfamily)
VEPIEGLMATRKDPARSLDPVARLVERSAGGDKDAYGQIFRLHHDAILRFVRLHLGGEGDDVASEVFVRAWIGLNRYQRSGVPFAAWLHGIARQVVADELSRRSRTQPQAEMPESLAHWAEDDRLALVEAISKLPTEHRQLIEMKFFMGLRNPHVAAVMNTTATAVNVRQWQALAALREQLEEDR